jgi:hypothetical protein
VDALAAAGIACGDGSDTSCDDPDSCDGAGSCVVNNEPATTECRGVAGDCDVAELCDGAGTCPADGLVAAATLCRPLAGGCDEAESCTGSDAACPPDGFQTAGTECQPSGGVCDVADTCTGSSAECADELQAAGTVCRPDAGTCDVAETCTGSGVACPPDVSIRVDFGVAAQPDAFADAAPLTTQFGVLGLIWHGAGAVLDESALPDLIGQSPPNFAAYGEGELMLGGATSTSADTMDVACPSEEVSFLVGAEVPAIFVAEAFDTLGNSLDDVGVQIDADLRRVTLRAVGEQITRVEYETFAAGPEETAPKFAVDDILVPEPDAMLVQLAALAALGALARKRLRIR